MKPGWLREAADRAEATLRSMPRKHIGPAGRRLLDAIDASLRNDSDPPDSDSVSAQQ